jgi:outer membrane protein TolC
MQSGGADMKDAVDPLKAYYEARALHLEARYNYLVSRAELAKAIGVPSLDLVAIKTEAGDE